MTEVPSENDTAYGPPSRHIDPITERLSAYAKAFEDAQKVRKASHLRGDELAAEMFKDAEDRLSRRLGSTLRKHELWPFLEPLKGLAGPLTARVISIIGDPRRFPGQQCEFGHTLPAIYPAGTPCPVVADPEFEPERHPGDDELSRGAEMVIESEKSGGTADFFPDTEASLEIERASGVGKSSRTGSEAGHENDCRTVSCAGTLRPPRKRTGVKSLYHYSGLHVVNGKLPMRRKGQQADWNPALRTLALQPNGLADQIIKHRTPKYREIYDAAKDRGKHHKVARTIAVKQFLGDLLVAWKEIAGGAESAAEIENVRGPSSKDAA